MCRHQSARCSRRCLVKDRRQRVTDIATALFVLRASSTGLSAAGAAADAAVADARTPAVASALAPRTGVLLVGARRLRRRGGVARYSPCRLRRRPHDDDHVQCNCVDRCRAAIATSPSRPTAHASFTAAIGRLLVRALDQLEPTVLSGPRGAPRRLHLTGRAVGRVFRRQHDQESGDHWWAASDHRFGRPRSSRGATWGPDGTIIFATGTSSDGLQTRVRGGRPATVLTKPDRARGEGDHVLARVPAWRRRRPLHDYSGQRQHRERADRSARSADR